MNIKTTIVLLVLLLGVGAYVFFTRDKGNTDDTPKHDEHTLLDVKEGLITGFSITGSDGKIIAAQKSKNADGMDAWNLTSPVKAPAETYKVSSLISALTALKSNEQMPANSGSLSSTELDHPKYTIDLSQGPTTTELKVGKAQSVGDGLYVQVKGQDQIEVVPASLLETLSKPASSLRKDRLFETAAPSVMQLSVAHKTGPDLVLQKDSGNWRMTRPEAMPADASAVEDLASAVINMQPVEYVDDPSMALGLDKPQATVTFSTVAPSTQPTTAPTTQLVSMPGAVKVIFGSYDDVNKKNVFAEIPDGTIVKVPASVLDSLNKKPFELRDKTVFDVEPANVAKVSIEINQPATTQPTTMPASKSSTLLVRQHPPSTQPVIGPTLAAAEWKVMGSKPVDADDAKMTALLGHFHALKAEKYLEKPTAGKIVKQYTVTLFTTGGPEQEMARMRIDMKVQGAELSKMRADLTYTEVSKAIAGHPDLIKQVQDAEAKAKVPADPKAETTNDQQQLAAEQAKLSEDSKQHGAKDPIVIADQARVNALTVATVVAAHQWATAAKSQVDAEQTAATAAEKALPAPAPLVLTLVDPGNDANLIGSYNGLNFELLRSITTDLTADFAKPAAATAAK